MNVLYYFKYRKHKKYLEIFDTELINFSKIKDIFENRKWVTYYNAVRNVYCDVGGNTNIPVEGILRMYHDCFIDETEIMIDGKYYVLPSYKEYVKYVKFINKINNEIQKSIKTQLPHENVKIKNVEIFTISLNIERISQKRNRILSRL